MMAGKNSGLVIDIDYSGAPPPRKFISITCMMVPSKFGVVKNSSLLNLRFSTILLHMQ